MKLFYDLGTEAFEIIKPSKNWKQNEGTIFCDQCDVNIWIQKMDYTHMFEKGIPIERVGCDCHGSRAVQSIDSEEWRQSFGVSKNLFPTRFTFKELLDREPKDWHTLYQTRSFVLAVRVILDEAAIIGKHRYPPKNYCIFHIVPDKEAIFQSNRRHLIKGYRVNTFNSYYVHLKTAMKAIQRFQKEAIYIL